MGHLFVLSWARVRRCFFGVMYGEWYGVCDFGVVSVVEVCADYGGVNVFHVCLNWVCINVCGVVCVVVCLFLGGVPLWVVCVFRCVDVCLCLLCTQFLFCMLYSSGSGVKTEECMLFCLG